MSLAATPAASSAASAPACSRSVTKSWYFETMTAKQNSVARPLPSIVGIPALPALELRLALLQKRRRALAHVFGGGDEAEQRRFVLARFGERHLDAFVHSADDVSHGDRRARGKLRGERAGFRHQFRGCDDSIHE